MKRAMIIAAFFCPIAALAACNDPPTPTASSATATASSAAPVTTSTTTSHAGPNYRDEDVPIPEDFEEQAEKDITPENYKNELAKETSEPD